MQRRGENSCRNRRHCSGGRRRDVLGSADSILAADQVRGGHMLGRAESADTAVPPSPSLRKESLRKEACFFFRGGVFVCCRFGRQVLLICVVMHAGNVSAGGALAGEYFASRKRVVSTLPRLVLFVGE